MIPTKRRLYRLIFILLLFIAGINRTGHHPPKLQSPEFRQGVAQAAPLHDVCRISNRSYYFRHRQYLVHIFPLGKEIFPVLYSSPYPVPLAYIRQKTDAEFVTKGPLYDTKTFRLIDYCRKGPWAIKERAVGFPHFHLGKDRLWNITKSSCPPRQEDIAMDFACGPAYYPWEKEDPSAPGTRPRTKCGRTAVGLFNDPRSNQVMVCVVTTNSATVKEIKTFMVQTSGCFLIVGLDGGNDMTSSAHAIAWCRQVPLGYHQFFEGE